MDFFTVSLIVFLASLFAIVAMRRKTKKDEVGAQFVITATLLLVFYIICFFSAICSILNFLFRWVL